MSALGNKEIMAKNIKYYMELHGKTRSEICEALGVKYTTFSDWVKGNSYPRIDKIELLANYFGIEKSDLVEDKEKQLTIKSVDDLIAKTYGSDSLEVLSLYIQLDSIDRGSVLERIRMFLEQDKYSRQKGIADA